MRTRHVTLCHTTLFYFSESRLQTARARTCIHTHKGVVTASDRVWTCRPTMLELLIFPLFLRRTIQSNAAIVLKETASTSTTFNNHTRRVILTDTLEKTVRRKTTFLLFASCLASTVSWGIVT